MSTQLFERTEDGSYLLRLPSSVYRCSAVKKAAYKFANTFFVGIDEPEPGVVSIVLKPKGCVERDYSSVIGEFCNELLDQELRESISEETSGIRDLILAQAFSQVSIFHPEFDKPTNADAEAASAQ